MNIPTANFWSEIDLRLNSIMSIMKEIEEKEVILRNQLDQLEDLLEKTKTNLSSEKRERTETT